MKAIIAAALLLCMIAPTKATQYDAVIGFSSITAAKADPDVQKHYDAIEDAFASDRVVQIKVWRPSQDTTDGDGNVVHNYLTGVFFLISLPRLVTSLRDNPAIRVVIDRDKCNARQSGCIVK